MIKILTVDIGNSFTKLGLFVDGQLETIDYFPTEKDISSSGQSPLLTDSPLPDGLLYALDGVVIASVVPGVTESYCQVFESCCQISPFVINRDTLSSINTGSVNFNAYAKGQLGADRIANSLAGFELYGEKLVLVIDSGTATTFEMVDTEGCFIGGAICPGPRRFQSLIHPNVTAQLFEVDVFAQPKETPGLNTTTSLQNGLYYGYKGAILEITGNLLQSAGWPLSKVNIVFTGGFAQEVREMVQLEMAEAHIDRELTLKGLRRLWELNCGKQTTVSSPTSP